MSQRAEPGGRIIPPVYLLAAVVLMVTLGRLAPGMRLLHSPSRFLGLIPLVCGVSLTLWAAGLFRRAGTTVRPFHRSEALVVSGPYRFTRNPMYLGMVIALVGVGVLLGSLTPFVVIPVFVALIDRRVIRVEESMLLHEFGSAYTDLKSRVRRWL